MIKNKIKKIFSLSNIFLKDSYQNLNIINFENHKLNKKSIFLWMIIFLLLSLFWVCEKGIKFLVQRGLSEVFLNIYFLIFSVLIMFQTVLVCTNIFYFSKDIEFILPLPIKPTELLISKFITLITGIYIFEFIFGIIPLFLYGIYNNYNFLFYINTIIILIIFPLFLSLFISIIMMFVMKISKFIKNKDIFQLIITLFLISFIFFIEYKTLGTIIVNNGEIENIDQEQVVEKILDFNNRIKNSNKYFLVINPSINVLLNSNFKSFIEIFKILLIDFITFYIFILIGKITYLKDILRNATYLINKKNTKMNIQKKCKKNNRIKSYIKKEFKNLFRNPMFFMQCIYPVIITLITIIIMGIIIKPKLQQAFLNEEFKNIIGNISFDITTIYLVLGIMQFLFMLSMASLTSFSRDGKNSSFVKYIPITYYKQFICKGIPQILINTFSIIVILGILYYVYPSINLIYLLDIFILGYLLNIINSYIMIIIDLLNPKLEWDSEYALLKQNNNKIFQYVFAIFVILFLVYLNNIFENSNLDFSIFLTEIIFIAIIIIINIFVFIKQKKLFRKII
ncbi:MAG: hypothetical protein U0L98_02080 [Clostridia bacterium]|nr:hypothetical protein [Clostridia bacterium]